MTELTQEYLQSILEYNAFTGLFTRLKRKSANAAIGDVAGFITSDGYVKIKIDGKPYFAHRLVWLYAHGRWPKEQIDHVNGIRADNRLTNLRECNARQNKWNSKSFVDSVVPYRGVSRRPGGLYRARIVVNGEFKSLGNYRTPEEAKAAYDLKAKELHGEFYTERTK